MENYLSIGKIVNTQGVKGEVKVVPHTFDVKRFELLDEITLVFNSNILKYHIEHVKYNNKFVIIKFKQVKDMNDAEKIKNYIIMIPETQALPLDSDEYYYKDLIDMVVFDDDGNELGIISDIIETGSNDVYVVTSKDVVKNKNVEILIPAIKQCIINVDLVNNKMVVKLMEGLI